MYRSVRPIKAMCMSSVPHVICSSAADVILDEDLEIYVQLSGGVCSFTSAIMTVVLPEKSVEGSDRSRKLDE